MAANNVVPFLVVTFVAILAAFVFIRIIVVHCCCFETNLRKRRTTDETYTAPIVYNTTATHTYINETNGQTRTTTHIHHLGPEGESSQYTYHYNTQDNTHDNGGFRARRDSDSDSSLPMCNPMQAYPMPAPEHSTRPSSPFAAHSVSVSEHTSQRLRESPPIPTAPSFDRVTEDLPPSYDEAVTRTKAGND